MLTYVVDDGLHECRLVCRQWRDACGKLPVELGTVMIPSDKLQRAVELFPEAKTLKMYNWFNEEIEETQIVPHLLRLQNLKHFILLLPGQSIDLQNLIACLSSIQHLQSLNLWISHENMLLCLLRGLCCLKKLTSLSVIHDFVFQNDLDPDSDVQGLNHLEIAFELMINRRSELVFPMLTGLTSLGIRHSNVRRSQQVPHNLQVCQLLYTFV